MVQPVTPDSWGDTRYVEAAHCILTDSETMEITQCQNEFLEAYTRYYCFRDGTNKLDNKISREEIAERLSEEDNRRETMEEILYKAMLEEEEKGRIEAIGTAQQEEDCSHQKEKDYSHQQKEEDYPQTVS